MCMHVLYTENDSRLSYYFDLEVRINNRKFTMAGFDKRDGLFSFPHMDSNTPSKPARGLHLMF